MAVRVARALGSVLRSVGAGLVAGLIGSAALAAADEPGTLPSLSANCQAPTADISSTAPLPRLTAELKRMGRLRVLAIGSAATVPLGLPGSAQGYPAMVESILERTFKGLEVDIVNRGVSGEVASAMADRLKVQVALEQPDLVLWQVGTTDALARVPVAEFKTTVRDTLLWLKGHRIDTVLVGLQYNANVVKDEHYNDIRTALRDVASEENVLLVRRYDAMRFLEVARKDTVLPFDELRGRGDDGCVAEHIARAVVVSAFLGGSTAGARR
jgi:acyl-CoA thioesterase I